MENVAEVFSQPQEKFFALSQQTIREAEEQAQKGTNPLWGMWLHPRAAIEHVLKHTDSIYSWVLAMLAGFLNTLPTFFALSSEKQSDPGYLLVYVLLNGILRGAFFWILFSWLLSMTGRWMGGVARYGQVRAAVAWSMLPAILLGLVHIPLVLLCHNASWIPDADTISSPLGLGLVLVETGLTVWAVVLLLKTVSQVHRINLAGAFAAFLSMKVLLGAFALLIWWAVKLPAMP